jgi:hypothetical protein
MHPEGRPYKLKRTSTYIVTPQTLPKFYGLCVRRKQTKDLLVSSLFLLSYKWSLKGPPRSRTHKSALRGK